MRTELERRGMGVGALRRGVLAISLTWISAAALAAPGSPGTPGPAKSLFTEDFQSRDLATPVGIENYRGGAYTADPYWINKAQCNGIVYSRGNIPATGSDATLLGCPDFRDSHSSLERLIRAIAVNHNVSPDTESVLSSYTLDETVVGQPGVVIETLSPVQVPLNRFVTAGVDSANTNCNRGGSRPPEYNFFLIGSAQTLDLNFSGQSNGSACTLGKRLGPGFDFQTYFYPLKGKKASITNIGSARLRVRNENGGYQGNDAAIDNVAIYDVTPQIDQQFAPGPLTNGAYGVNKPARMTLTVTNTDDLLEKAGWGFIETLPANLLIAPVPDLQTTCTLASPVVATAGTSVIRISGGTLPNAVGPTGTPVPGLQSCTVSFNVTSSVAGTYQVTKDSASQEIGLDLPGNASVNFVNEPVIRLQKAFSGSRLSDTDQFSLSITNGSGVNVAVTTTGSGGVVASAPALLNPATAGTAYTLAEAAAGSTVLGNYAGRYSCTNATAGGQTPSGTGTSFSITPAATDDLTCTFTNSALVADLQVVKTPNVPTSKSGDLVTFSIVATNAGPAAADNAVLRDVPGTGLDCPAASTTATCSASGGAVCPSSTVAVSALTGSTGITIPTLPVGGQVTLTLQCRVTASGTP